MTDEELIKIITDTFNKELAKIDFKELHKAQLDIIDLTAMFNGEFSNKPTKEQAALVTFVAKGYFTATIKAIIALKRNGIL